MLFRFHFTSRKMALNCCDTTAICLHSSRSNVDTHARSLCFIITCEIVYLYKCINVFCVFISYHAKNHCMPKPKRILFELAQSETMRFYLDIQCSLYAVRVFVADLYFYLILFCYSPTVANLRVYLSKKNHENVSNNFSGLCFFSLSLCNCCCCCCWIWLCSNLLKVMLRFT